MQFDLKKSSSSIVCIVCLHTVTNCLCSVEFTMENGKLFLWLFEIEHTHTEKNRTPHIPNIFHQIKVNKLEKFYSSHNILFVEVKLNVHCAVLYNHSLANVKTLYKTKQRFRICVGYCMGMSSVLYSENSHFFFGVTTKSAMLHFV